MCVCVCVCVCLSFIFLFGFVQVSDRSSLQAIDEAEEWSQHNAKKLIDTSEKR